MLNIRHLYGRLVPQNLSWSFCVKAEAKLAGLLLRAVPLIFGQLSASLVKVVWGYSKNVRRIYRGSGPQGLAKYLKTCHVLLQQVAGGQKLGNPWEIGCNVSRTRRGLPRIMNPQHRRMVYQGDVAVIRFWMTLFGLYRVVEFKGALKLKTITAPGKDITAFRKDVWSGWVPIFFAKAESHTATSWKMDPSHALTPWSIPFMRKSAPNSAGLPSISALATDLLLFASDTEMLALLKKWLKAVDGLDLLWAINPIVKIFEKISKNYLDKLAGEWREGKREMSLVYSNLGVQVYPTEAEGNFYLSNGQPLNRVWLYKELTWPTLTFGKLGFKEEPGKIRVFAMVNCITQTLMYPLHKWIFDQLRKISTDGTFNQIAPVERLIKRFKKERQFVASYDLSAATDRLPLLLQMDLLTHLMGDTLSTAWARLLVGRPYRLPKIAKSYNLGFNSVAYSVGQPMGALSSWAMLALTHHALVQLAAHRVLPHHEGWFLFYAVLGDDIVIGDKLVAAEYLRIMETIGVEVGLAKSMVSTSGSLEFAKRTYIRGRNCSPVSLAELLVALCHLGALDQLVRKCETFGTLRVSSVARFAGFGYKNLGRLPVSLSLNNRLSSLIAYLCRPGGVWPMPVEAWLTAIGPGRHGEAASGRLWATAQSLWDRLVGMLISRNVAFERTLYLASGVRYTDATHRVKESVTLPNGRKRSQSTDKRVFGPSAFKTLGLEGNEVEWNTFFTDWVAYPFTNRLRKTFEKIDDILRVLRPGVLPEWTTLDGVWSQVFEADEGQSALPKRIDYFTRESDEAAPSTRLVTLWRKLRLVALRKGSVSEALIRAKPPYPKPESRLPSWETGYRRRRGG